LSITPALREAASAVRLVDAEAIRCSARTAGARQQGRTMKSAICLIVRNEVRDIAEWIAFHALLGFDAQIIFDNASTDGTDRVIKAAANLHDVRYHAWPNTQPRSQCLSYEVACKAYGLEFDWIAFLDSDEFLIPQEFITANTFLARYDNFSGIAVPWAIYGANGHDELPELPVLQSFTRRAPVDFFPARHVKSIVRPRFASRCLNPHCFDLAGHKSGSYCDPRGRIMQWLPAPEHGGILAGVARETPDYGMCRVNHYFTRSRAHWRAKLQRGYPGAMDLRSDDEFEAYDRNDVSDPIALRYLPALLPLIEAINERAGPAPQIRTTDVLAGVT
jgi:glycosyltransferase involved in cell wall biosynthesis